MGDKPYCLGSNLGNRLGIGAILGNDLVLRVELRNLAVVGAVLMEPFQNQSVRVLGVAFLGKFLHDIVP